MNVAHENLNTYTLGDRECCASIYFKCLCSHAIPDTHFRNFKHYVAYAHFEHQQLLKTQNKYQKWILRIKKPLETHFHGKPTCRRLSNRCYKNMLDFPLRVVLMKIKFFCCISCNFWSRCIWHSKIGVVVLKHVAHLLLVFLNFCSLCLCSTMSISKVS